MLYPEHGLFKLSERLVDRTASRYVFPHLFGLARFYSWQLPRTLQIAETSLSIETWPASSLHVLLVSDVHAGPLLNPKVLEEVLGRVMDSERPDLVAFAGDSTTGQASDLPPFRDALAVLARAPLGAWFCLGNHDHFAEEPDEVMRELERAGIRTLRNETARIAHGEGSFVIGGVDDRVLGAPDWEALQGANRPDVLLAHNPDDLFQAADRAVPLVLSGHTHGGQIRFARGGPIIRQSRFYLDEGVFRYGQTQQVVSRGLGVSGLPWRMGAMPEVVSIHVSPAADDQ